MIAAALRTAVLVSAGCGRLGFDATSSQVPGDGDTTPGDAVGSFCAGLVPAPAFCEDFETGTAAAWDDMNTFGGTFAVDSKELVVTIPPIGTSGSAGVYLQKYLAAAPRVVTSFDVETPVSNAAEPIIAQIEFRNGGDLHFIEYVHRFVAPYIEEYVENATYPGGMYFYTNLPPTNASRHRIALDIVTGAGGSVTFAVDGATLAMFPLMDPSAGAVRAVYGVTYLGGPSAAWEVRIDNIVVDLL